MNRFGQCPACRQTHPLCDDAIGSTLDCQCGRKLLAANADGFTEIPIFCCQCERDYVVDRDGAGETVQCECGSEITVPDIVLRPPIKHSGPPTDFATVSQTDPNHQASALETLRKPVAKGKATAARRPTSYRRKRSPTLIIGIAAVLLLFCFSVGFFVNKTVRKSTQSQAEPARDTPPAPVAEFAPITDNSALQNVVSTNTALGVSSPRQPLAKPTLSRRASSKDRDESPLRFPPPPRRELPQREPARPIIPIPSLSRQGLTFQRAYQEAFESFRETRELQEKPNKISEYHAKLGRTLAMLQDASSKVSRQQSGKEIADLNYLLTYLYFRSGRLPEAAILGEATARWGDAKKEATKEAALIAMAAMQEANQTHWGNPAEVGELNQMQKLINVYATRWPDDPQIHTMHLSLGGSYERFNQPLKAADVLSQIPNDSSLYATAQLAAGNALWTEYRQRLSEAQLPGATDDMATVASLLQRAQTSLANGVQASIDSGKGVSTNVMVAKLNLARIALTQNDANTAEAWLVDGPIPLKDSIGQKKSDGVVKVNASMIRIVYEMLYSIRLQNNDLTGAQKVAAEMSRKLGSKDGAQASKMYLSIATDFIGQLSQQPNISKKDLSRLAQLIDPLETHDQALTATNLMWFGESWFRLASKTANDTLSKQCYEKAAAAYELAMSRDDFPAKSLQAATLRRLELVRAAGRLDEAYAAMCDLLEQTPNAFGMQIQAAQAIQDLGLANRDASKLVEAVEGPNNSPVWGWKKLIVVLHAQANAVEDQAINIQRLMQCRYNLLWCQWQIALATMDPAAKKKRITDLRRALAQIKTTMKSGVEPWYQRFQQLSAKIE